MQRPYDSLTPLITSNPDRAAAMQAFVDALWPALHPTGVSWLGFYVYQSGDELILGPRRDKPACSPIGLHGACGQAFTSRTTLIVRDVADLGPNYIACDPRDKSEIVLPLLEKDGRCWGVFDVDSWDVASFDESDEEGLTMLLKHAGLTHA
ncbi:MAG: GAF domain-containing protein [Planctomycetes bacterium]|nr:GAF domain-containing protein [Planctomycetota bacterium]